MPYAARIVDDELDELFPHLAAIAIEGAKGVGKTETATRRSATTLFLDDPAERALLDSDPSRLDRLPMPVLLDEWQRYPQSWDLVRRSVDRDSSGNRFLLTGSALPSNLPTHSRAGRIVRLHMRPLSLAERALAPPAVGLRQLLVGEVPNVDAESQVDLSEYAGEILRSGLPGIRDLPTRARSAQLDGYLARLADVEFPEQGHPVRRPATLRAWLTAYAAGTASTAAYNTILDAAMPGDRDKPAKTTTIAWRDVLARLWVLDPLPGWVPGENEFTRLIQAPKHHLADPALAARLLGATEASLLRNRNPVPSLGHDGFLLAALFESLVTLSVRVYAQACEASVFHMRTHDGSREIDLIVEGADRRVVAIEVKLTGSVEDRDVAHLVALRQRLGDRVAATLIVTPGRHAYRRRDGVLVVPAALLGP